VRISFIECTFHSLSALLEPRRAAVALVIRIALPPSYPTSSGATFLSSQPQTTDLNEFFQLDWVRASGARPEILFLRRENPQESTDGGRMNETGHAREAHLAFPGMFIAYWFIVHSDILMPSQVVVLRRVTRVACIPLCAKHGRRLAWILQSPHTPQ
jgi:hypothetical protein